MMNEDKEKCRNCKWIGKKNALLKHLRMKSLCKSKYNMNSLYIEHLGMKKVRKSQYDQVHYDQNKEKKKENYQKRRTENSIIPKQLPCAIKEDELKTRRIFSNRLKRNTKKSITKKIKMLRRNIEKSILKQTKKPKKNTGGIIMR